MKNRILLKNYYLPGELERQIGTFVDHYNNHRYHKSLNNVTPADSYLERDKDILRDRKTIKKNRQSSIAACNIKNKLHHQNNRCAKDSIAQNSLMSHFI